MAKNRISSFDSLRGIAIFGVLVNHAYFIDSPTSIHKLIKSLGRYGVQLFFIISGIMITYTWINKKVNLKTFYFNRLYRVLPLFIVSGFIYNLDNLNSSTYKLMLIFTSHFISPEYSNIETAAPGGWSIVAEIFFYLLFPILFIILKKKNIYYIFFVQSIVYLFYNFFFQQKIIEYMLSKGISEIKYIENYLFFNFFNQLPIFLLGIGLYYCLYENNSISKFYLLQFALIALTYFLRVLILNYSISEDLIEVAKNVQLNFLIFYIFLSLVVVLFVKFNLNNRYLNYLGRYSYGVYIFHYLGATLAFKLSNFYNGGGYITYFTCFTIMLTISLILSKLSEDFLLKNKDKTRKFVRLG